MTIKGRQEERSYGFKQFKQQRQALLIWEIPKREREKLPVSSGGGGGGGDVADAVDM